MGQVQVKISDSKLMDLGSENKVKTKSKDKKEEK